MSRNACFYIILVVLLVGWFSMSVTIGCLCCCICAMSLFADDDSHAISDCHSNWRWFVRQSVLPLVLHHSCYNAVRTLH